MNDTAASKIYDPVGRCIYCGATNYSDDEPNRRLGEEHIIPRSIGGTLVLPEASCKTCEKITSATETRCIPLYDPGRYHLGIRGRKLRKARSRLPVQVGSQGKRVTVGKPDHPGVLWSFKYGFPSILIGQPPGGDFAGNPQMAPIVPDWKERIRRLGGMYATIGAGVTNDDFGRFLAKVAHAYAVAERGMDSFSPLLLNVIRGEHPYSLPWIIGCPLGLEDRPGATQHEISFAAITDQHVTVRIRLFGAYYLPTYYVVAGFTQ